MQHDSFDIKKTPAFEVGVYECEVRLKFRLIEEKGALDQQASLLEALIDAFAYGSDDYLEPIQAEATAKQICELVASPQMRRQLIRLRNSNELA
jgi:uncharacterized protein YktB (UPF0637 family)